jgi:hypothetical protein
LRPRRVAEHRAFRISIMKKMRRPSVIMID